MTIKVNPLDPDSIDAAIEEIEEYERTVDAKSKELVEQLKDLGIEKAKELIPVYSGEAKDSIIGYVDADTGKGAIVAGGYCKYIEFGTGVNGEGKKHPSPEYIALMGWAYNKGATIFTTKDGKQGWYYPTDDGSWRFTQGMPSRPFLYETAQYLRREVTRMAKELFEDG